MPAEGLQPQGALGGLQGPSLKRRRGSRFDGARLHCGRVIPAHAAARVAWLAGHCAAGGAPGRCSTGRRGRGCRVQPGMGDSRRNKINHTPHRNPRHSHINPQRFGLLAGTARVFAAQQQQRRNSIAVVKVPQAHKGAPQTGCMDSLSIEQRGSTNACQRSTCVPPCRPRSRQNTK